MNKERLSLLEGYLQVGISPLLIPNLPANTLNNSVVIKADIDRSELNGHYENVNFCPPFWYKELLAKSKTHMAILVIENINEINLKEQTKFIEILKYKKVSTFELPENCMIIVTCSDLTTNKINEEVYSLMAQI